MNMRFIIFFKIPEQYEKVAILMAPNLNLILYSHF